MTKTHHHRHPETDSDGRKQTQPALSTTYTAGYSLDETMTRTLSSTRRRPVPDLGAIFRPESDPPNDVPPQLGDIDRGVKSGPQKWTPNWGHKSKPDPGNLIMTRPSCGNKTPLTCFTGKPVYAAGPVVHTWEHRQSGSPGDRIHCKIEGSQSVPETLWIRSGKPDDAGGPQQHVRTLARRRRYRAFLF